MIDFECNVLYNHTKLIEIGKWLEANMPNPPLPEQQRWTIGYDGYRTGIQFTNDKDATLFGLVVNSL